MANSLMNTGVSGLRAAQNKLDVIHNNISNAHTPGYNRQQLVLNEANVTKTGDAGFIGNGVVSNPVTRMYNEFVVGQLRDAQSKSGSADVYYDRLSRVDNLLSDSDAGVSSQLNTLFSNLNQLSTDVSRQSVRQAVLSSLQALSNRFNESANGLKSQISGVNTNIEGDVKEINTYTKKIAELNEKIARLQGPDGTGDPNALLDDRDKLVNDLNKLIGVTVTIQNGEYNLSIANGLSLVQGSQYSTLSVAPSTADPSMNSIIYTFKSGDQQELSSRNVKSGQLHGLLTFREGPLSDARNQLGLVALHLAERFNQVHESGIDVNGNPGEKLFSYDKPESISNSKNTGNAEISVNYSSVKDVQASEYSVKFSNNDWIVTRLSDNSRVAPIIQNGQLAFDGLTLTINGVPNNNDSFRIKPVADVANSLTVLINDPDKIATGIEDADSGSGDNRNVLNLRNIQDEKLINGTSTLHDGFSRLVSFVGHETREAETSQTVFKSLVDQITQQNESISGVNLDEEYVEMQKYMQYYQANAKVIDSATTIFDTILGLRG